MKTQPPLWIFSPFGQPSYCTTRSHCPFGSMRKMRPKGISTHQRFPSRSNEGPSRKLSTAEPCRLGSDQAVRRFLRNFAGSEVKVRASMCLTFWNGLCIEAPPACTSSIALFLHPLLDRVLDVLDLVDLDVEQPAADLLDTADVNRLDDVASLRIDSDRAARAFPSHALGGRDERLGVGLAAGLLQGFIDEVHPVPAADAEEVRVAPPGRVVGGDEFRVRRGSVVVVVVKGRDQAERGIAHDLQRVLLGDFALAQDAGLLRIDAEIHERLAECGRLRAAGDEYEKRLRVEVFRALHDRD